jgi:colanic acid biosynthesis glycosyl transferase WcaI
MRIALVSISYAPEAVGIGPYSADLAQALAARGHELQVVTTFPYYPAWKAKLPWWGVVTRTERCGDVMVRRYRCYVPRRPSGVRRALHDLSFASVTSPRLFRLTAWADVIVVVSPSFGSALQGALMCRLGWRRVHLHVQDLVTDLAVEAGLVRAGAGVLKTVDRVVYGAYSSISVLSDEMAAVLGARGVPPERITVIPNWVRRFPPAVPRCDDVPAAERYVLYSGSFGRKQDLAAVSELAARLEAQRGPQVLVLGDGVRRNDLKVNGNRWLRWAGILDDASYDACCSSALAGVVSLAHGVGNSVVPSKVASYMAASVPIVVLADADAPVSRLVSAVGCGIVVPAGDASAAAAAVHQIARSPMHARALGEKGFHFATANWSREALVSRLEERLIALSSDL